MTIPAKPAYGQPCNGCGVCCRQELCPLGELLYRRVKGPCPALSGPYLMTDGSSTYTCGLVSCPEKFAPLTANIVGGDRLTAAAKFLTGTGVGCDCQLPGEPDNPEYRTRLRRGIAGMETATERALFAWGVAIAVDEPVNR